MTDVAVITMCVTVVLMAVGQLIKSSNYVSKEEFKQFTTRMDQNLGLVREDIRRLGDKIT